VPRPTATSGAKSEAHLCEVLFGSVCASSEALEQAALRMLLQHYNFTEWDIRDVPAYWLREMINATQESKYQRELDRRVAELRRQDEMEVAAEKESLRRSA
jgi:hypothetical protein